MGEGVDRRELATPLIILAADCTSPHNADGLPNYSTIKGTDP